MLSRRFIYTAVAFFVIGVSLGMYMGINKDFRLTHVHVHINLLGWVALGLAGLLYNSYPHLHRSWMAHAHYWLHTIGLIIFMGGFVWGAISGEFRFIPVSVGASMVSLGVLFFAINIFTRLGAAPSGSMP